jgi:hypothetical protein
VPARISTLAAAALALTALLVHAACEEHIPAYALAGDGGPDADAEVDAGEDVAPDALAADALPDAREAGAEGGTTPDAGSAKD